MHHLPTETIEHILGFADTRISILLGYEKLKHRKLPYVNTQHWHTLALSRRRKLELDTKHRKLPYVNTQHWHTLAYVNTQHWHMLALPRRRKLELDTKLLSWLLKYKVGVYTESVTIRESIIFDALDITKALCKTKDDYLDAYKIGIMYGRKDVVEFAMQHVTYLDAINSAASQGQLELVKYFHTRGIEGCTTNAMDGAARNGHLDVVKYLHENRTEGCTTNAMDWAAENGHLDVVKYLHENRTDGCTTYAMNWAAKNGHLDVVKYLHENRSEGFTLRAIDKAEEYGHIDVVEYLYDKEFKCTEFSEDDIY